MALAFLMTLTGPAAQSPPPADPTPASIDEFQASAKRILDEAGVPGAGISLVRADGVEWEGGIGLADRDRGTPVTADTHFRVGSISKSFIAIAMVQMYYDDLVELEATVDSVVPEVAIENPWQATDPVRVIHLLQHTAGFDDMHFNEIYNDSDDPEMPLLEVLQRNPNARRVRWRPGTRMAYSNPGYGVAGYVIEKISGEPYEAYIESHILKPLQMHTSSFRLTPADEHILARGYGNASEPPKGFPAIYLRPAGNLHSSPREMGRFVRMLLNWGELDGEFIVDPEYLGNMERTRTTLAAEAGVRGGYGSGISWTHTLPYPVLGHGGGIHGFLSVYGYSPSRDVGYVILLNSDAPAAGRALDRLSSLAIRFLKRDVEPPVKARATVDPDIFTGYEGYYQDASDRHQILGPLHFFVAGRTIAREGNRLYAQPLNGERVELIPVTDTTFRHEHELDATMVFTRDRDGRLILTGRSLYAEQTPRWRVEIVRVSVAAALVILLSPALVAIVWVVRLRRAQPRGFWELKVALLLAPVLILVSAIALSVTPVEDLGARNGATLMLFLSTLALPALVLIVPALAIGVRREDASRALTSYAWLVAIATAGVTAYLGAHGLIALRLWAY